MSENPEAAALRRILNCLPSVPWSIRIDPSSMSSEWIYVSPKLAELYGLTDAEMREGPLSLQRRLEPEESARYMAALMASLQTMEPMSWTGKVVHPSGEVRWIETHMVHERDPDGTIVSCGHVLDVTERERTHQLHRAVIDALPAGVIAMTPDGQFPIYNRAAVRHVGPPRKTNDGDLSNTFGVFKTDGVTPFPDEDLPVVRALGGEEAPEAELIMRNGDLEGERWMHATGTPLRDEVGKIIAGMVVFHDVTRRRALEQELRTSNAQLSASEDAKQVLIDRLRYSIDELSTPILEVWDDVLVMPIIGVVDSRRTSDMVQRLLAEVARTQASFAIVDLTGVEIVDTKTADHLIKLIRKVEVVGARCVLTGIRPAVSEALVDLGVDFGRITTLRNLKHGLREALRHTRREREGMRDSGLADETSEEPRFMARERRRPQ